MRVVLQRVSQAGFAVNGESLATIEKGFMLLVGVSPDDQETDVDYLARKIERIRIFADDDGRMNRSIKDVGGSILSISQFTLFADTKKGNRPNFMGAAPAKQAQSLYKSFNDNLRQRGLTVKTGVFGADMQVSLVNDGPVTIILDSKVQ